LKKYIEILKKCPLFYDIEETELLRMLCCLDAVVDTYDKKYTIISEGTPAKYIGVVLSGSAQIIQVDYFGNRSILGNVVAGEVFVEAFACADTPSIPVSVIATEHSEIMLIKNSHILGTCEKNCVFHRRLIFNLMKDLAQKTIAFHQRAQIISKRTTREKLMSYLALQAQKAGQSSFVIPFDRQELADYLEVDRSGLSTELGKLKREGILICDKKKFVLL